MGFSMALSGGGIRGAAHLGALTALAEYGLRPSAIAGCSAGSIVAGLFACSVSLEDMKKMLAELSKNYKIIIDPEYFKILSSVFGLVLKRRPFSSGLLKGKKLERYLDTYTKGKDIKDCTIPIVIPSVDLMSGNTIVFVREKTMLPHIPGVVWDDSVKLSFAMAASSSFPTIFTPKDYRDMYLVDGGVKEMLPADLLYAVNKNKILSINVSPKYMTPKHKDFIEIASHSFSLMSERLTESSCEMQTMLIRPDIPEKAGLLSFEAIHQCYQAGYQAVNNNMQTIQFILA